MKNTSAYTNLQKEIARIEFASIQQILKEMIEQKKFLQEKIVHEIRNIKRIRKNIKDSEKGNAQRDLKSFSNDSNRYQVEIKSLKATRMAWSKLSREGEFSIVVADGKKTFTMDENYITMVRMTDSRDTYNERYFVKMDSSMDSMTPIQLISYLILYYKNTQNKY